MKFLTIKKIWLLIKWGKKSYIYRQYVLLFYIIFLLLLFFTITSPSLYGDEENEEPALELEVSGYFKTLWTFINDTDAGQEYTLNTNRFRLDTQTFIGKKMCLNLTYDVEARTGNIISSPFWDDIKNPQAASYWNLWSGTDLNSSFSLSHSLYRANFYYNPGFARFDIGKQRIAWGVMRFFRPTDLFNPESPLQIEAGERVGIDALRIRSKLFDNGRGELVYAPGRNPGEEKWAAKYGFYIGDYDVELTGGKITDNTILGLTFDGYVGDGGLRGEVIYVNPPGENSYILAAIGGDYTFSKRMTLTVEYLYNGGANPSVPGNFLSNSGIIRTKNKHFLNFGTSSEIIPLVNLNTFTSWDMEGNSITFFPSINWNLRENMDINLGVNLSDGSDGGDYSILPGYTFIEAKIYF